MFILGLWVSLQNVRNAYQVGILLCNKNELLSHAMTSCANYIPSVSAEVENIPRLPKSV